MASELKSRKDFRKRRHLRLRRKIVGDARRPRMCISVSNRWIRVQFIDDDAAVTLASVCSSALDGAQSGKSLETAGVLGEKAARLAIEKGIQAVVCDRGGRMYHGRVQAVADAARKAGLRF